MGIFKNWFGRNKEVDPTEEYMNRDTGYRPNLDAIEDYNKRFEVSPNVDVEGAVVTDKTGSKKGSDQKKEGKFWGKAGKYLGLLGAGYAVHKNRREIPFDNRAFNESLLQSIMQNMSDSKMNPVQQTQAILGDPGGNIDVGDIVSKIGQGYGNSDFENVKVGGQGTPIDPVNQGMLGFYGRERSSDFKW